MPSIRDQIVAAAVTTLQAGGGPAGLVITRFKLTPTATDLPAIAVYPGPEQSNRVFNQRRGPLSWHYVTLRLELRAMATAGQTADQALDPLYVWAVQRLMADESLGGLSDFLDEASYNPDAELLDKRYALAVLDFTVTYHTRAADPTVRA